MSDFVYQNTALLMQHHPAAAKGLQEYLRIQREESRKPSCQILPAKNGQPTLIQTASQPAVYLHSPDNPAQEMLKQMQPAMSRQPHLILLYSIGLGYALQALRGWIASNKLIVIEPDYDILLECLQIANWQLFLSSPNIHLFVGKKPVEDAVHLLQIHPSLLQAPTQLIPGRNVLPSDHIHLKSLQDSLNNTHPAIQSKTESYALLCGDAHQSLTQPMIYEAQEANLPLRGIHRPAYINRFLCNQNIWRETLGEPLPQKLLSLSKNVLRQDEWKAIADAGVQCCLWCYDDPFRGTVDDSFFSGLHHIFCYDPHIANKLQSVSAVSAVPVAYLPAATAFSVDTPKQCGTMSNQSWDLTFVGSTGLQRHDDVLTHWISQNHPVYQRVLKWVESFLSSGECVPYNELLSLSIPEWNGLTQQRNVYLQDIATFLVRRHYLSSLHDFPLQIFGDRGWNEPAWVGDLTKRYAGKSLKYAEESPYVYANSKINLNLFNIQCVNSPTIRMFDVMACGGFLLTEYRPFMDEWFNIGNQLDVFHTKEELIAKVHYYLTHDEERTAIAAAGQQLVLQQHRYRHRLPIIFQE